MNQYINILSNDVLYIKFDNNYCIVTYLITTTYVCMHINT